MAAFYTKPLEPILVHRYFPVIILLSACSPSNTECLEQLNNELGLEYAIPLTDLANEFERIVQNSNGSDFPDKCRNFLKPLAAGNDKEFYSRVLKNDEPVKSFLVLDTLIFKYNFYDSDEGLKKKYISTYWDSKYIKALSTLSGCKDLIPEYVSMIEETGGIGPVPMAQGAIFNYRDKDFNDPVVKRILAVEILLPYLTHVPEPN